MSTTQWLGWWGLWAGSLPSWFGRSLHKDGWCTWLLDFLQLVWSRWWYWATYSGQERLLVAYETAIKLALSTNAPPGGLTSTPIVTLLSKLVDKEEMGAVMAMCSGDQRRNDGSFFEDYLGKYSTKKPGRKRPGWSLWGGRGITPPPAWPA